MDSISAIWKTFLQKFLRVIGLSDNHARRINKLVQTDLEIPRRENVVGVCGKAETDWKESLDPKSGPRCHSREVRVNMTNLHFLQA